MAAPNPDTQPSPDTHTDSASGAAGGGVAALLARAVTAHTLNQASADSSYARRSQDWRSWVRRQRHAAQLAAALGIPIDWVGVGDDPDRGYGINRHYPGDRVTITDPASDPAGGAALVFIPDITADYGWLLLGACPNCPGTAVPVAQVAGLADLGDHHTQRTRTGPPLIAHGDPAHDPGCPLANPTGAHR